MVGMVKNILTNIILVVLVVLLSIPVWNNLSKNDVSLIADSYADLNIYMDIKSYSYSKENKKINKDISLVLRNQNKNSKSYDLILKLELRNSVNYDDLLIYVNDKEINLNKSIISKDESNIYILICSEELESYISKDINVRLNYSDFNISNLNNQFLIK